MPTSPLTDEQIAASLAPLVGWQRDGDAITKTFKLDTYLAGLAFATTVGTLCDGLDHHPDLVIGWKKVTITFTTHDAGSKISAKDISAAAAIEALPYPKKG